MRSRSRSRGATCRSTTRYGPGQTATRRESMSKDSDQRDVEARAEEMGWHINPPLHEQLIEDYRGNPAIERLPPFRTEDDVIQLLQRRPAFDSAHRDLPSEARVHLIDHAMQELFVPLP